MTDNFEKDINVPSKQKIMYDYNAKDCEQCNPDSVCCYCKNIACYKLEEQLKIKEQECDMWKNLTVDNGAVALKYQQQLDQLNAENEELKEYIKHLHNLCGNETDKQYEYKQILTEIKEIASKFDYWNNNLSQASEILHKIIEKINEVLDEEV